MPNLCSLDQGKFFDISDPISSPLYGPDSPYVPGLSLEGSVPETAINVDSWQSKRYMFLQFLHLKKNTSHVSHTSGCVGLED